MKMNHHLKSSKRKKYTKQMHSDWNMWSTFGEQVANLVGLCIRFVEASNDNWNQSCIGPDYLFQCSKRYCVMWYHFVIYWPRLIHKNFIKSIETRASVRYNFYNFLDNTPSYVVNSIKINVLIIKNRNFAQFIIGNSSEMRNEVSGP